MRGSNFGRCKTTAYYTYILRCSDGSLYTGITTDLARRFAQHAGGKKAAGAKYTAARQPVAYECAFLSQNRSEASRLEYRIKQLSRAEKLALIAGHTPETLELDGYERIELDK